MTVRRVRIADHAGRAGASTARPHTNGRGNSHLPTCYMFRVEPYNLQNCDCGRVKSIASYGPDGEPEHQVSLGAIGWGCSRTLPHPHAE